MAQVRLNRQRVEFGQLPKVCICCGSAADRVVTHAFYWQPTWLVLFYWILPRWVKWSLNLRPISLRVPLCSRHSWRLKLPLYFMGVTLLPLILLIPAMIALTGLKSDWIGVVGALLALNALISLLGYLVLAIFTPRLNDYGSGWVEFTAVPQSFVQAVAGGVTPGATGLPAAGMGQRPLPGLPQQYKPIAGMSPTMLTLLIGGGCVGGTLLFVCGGIGAMYATGLGPWKKMQPIANRPAMPHEFPGAHFPPPYNQPPHYRPPPYSPSPSRGSATPETSSQAPGPPGPPGPPRNKATPATTDVATETESPANSESATSEPSFRVPEPAAGNREPTDNSPAAESTASPMVEIDPTFNERTRPVPRFRDRVPEGSLPVAESSHLSPGSQVWALWGNTWFAAQVVAAEAGDSFRVHYYGRPAAFDESLPLANLRFPKPAATTSGQPTAAAPITGGHPFPRSERAAPAAPPAPEMRTWTDSTGQHKIEAKLIEMVDGNAKLQRADGKVVTLSLEKLSPADQAYARRYALP